MILPGPRSITSGGTEDLEAENAALRKKARELEEGSLSTDRTLTRKSFAITEVFSPAANRCPA
ncbi:hypothetical protein ACFC0L_11035 [Streptomyces brevispora]|uniref:hypothetical protein n=1 Tax=Streptomyces brevispora TaxID=887462 RepID=UPI0011A7769A|nr:hypothetical protein [Streptomyces brevispora]